MTIRWTGVRSALPHHTVVFYMGVAQMPRIVSRLMDAGASPDHPAALIERGSLADQRVIRATPRAPSSSCLPRANVQPPALLIVGEVASPRANWAKSTSPATVAAHESSAAEAGAIARLSPSKSSI